MPAGVVTVTVTVPVPGGLVTVICVLESEVILPATPPKVTPVAPARPVPVIDTVVPPAVLPLSGDMPVTAGRGAPKVYWSAAVSFDVPVGVVTMTSTVPVPVIRVPESAVMAAVVTVMPAVPVLGGLATVIRVSEPEVIRPATPPKVTRVAWPRPWPVMVTVVPPRSVPPSGDTPVTAGSAIARRRCAVVPGQASGQGRTCRHDHDRGADRDGGLDRAEPQDAAAIPAILEMPQMPEML